MSGAKTAILDGRGDALSAPLVSVIVPHLDDLSGLATLAAALDRQSLPHDRFEIIVGDNGSSCGIDAVRRTIPAAVVVSVAERGAGPARNGAVAAARGKIIAFTDSDCVPDRHWLEEGIKALASSDVIGGRVRVGMSDEQRPAMTEAFEAVFAFDNQAYIAHKGFSVTANLFVTRASFDAVGPFRKAVSEDVDWCRRAVRQGLTLGYSHTASITHPARRTFADLIRKWRRTDREAFALWRDDGGSRAGWALRALAVFLSPAVHWLKVARSPALRGLGPRMSAMAALVTLRTMRCGWMLAQALSPQPAEQRHVTPENTVRAR
jgi:GT2 family glycosyltransferase